ncbi:glycosyltransferase family 4 protein [Granulicella sibirica]|uniref:Glycosyltransferase n=1 Tax=Granulicella sibirica TaxID=2479048 RepID=A0A4Q0SWR1_9BACT|nr:glycosyltransferase family 4 protein [Granulicella sibirica]RXH54008.1 Glycosyltransferase [Granulicella sibirica]
MRVLLTTDTIGGVWTFGTILAHGLMARGHSVALVSLGRAPSRSQLEWTVRTSAQFGAAFRYKASEVPLEWMAENQFAYSDAEGLLLQTIGDFQVEVVHASQFCFGALQVEVPKVLTAHSDVLSWAEACRPDGLEDSRWLRTYQELVSCGLQGADRIVAPTQWMRDALTRNFAAASGARVILNGRSLTLEQEKESRTLTAVTVGRAWDEAKGMAVLDEIEASIPVQVIGEESFAGTQAPQWGKVEFLGRRDDGEVFKALRRSSIYLATSIYEPFGLAPLEAALCGCGVVARDIESLREVWGSGADYFRDADGLSRAMLRLRDSQPQREALQARSLARAQELSAARMVDAYIAEYEEMLTARSVSQEDVAAYAI